MSLIIGVILCATVSLSATEKLENCKRANIKKWESYSDAELKASIKTDAADMAAKLKILSGRYYSKAKESAKSGKKEAYDAYNSCAAALKEMGDGFERNKAELIEKGKEAYKKAKIKMKELTGKLSENSDK